MPMQNSPTSDKLAYSVGAFAEAVSLSKSRVWALIKEGEISPKRCGHRVLIPADEAKRFIDSLRAA